MIHSLTDLKSVKGPVHLALGVFDGVHVGHQQVIASAVEAASSSGGSAGALTFFPHPIQVLAPQRAPKRILASLNHKSLLLEELGCSFMAVQEFSIEFAASSGQAFIEEVVHSCDQLKSVSVGEDWQFGKGREGNVEALTAWGKELGFEVYATEPVMSGGERVSSTRIRQAIRDGCLESIQMMLGRSYTVMGDVLKGRQLARQLGFPTANIKVQNEQLPPDGVWKVSVKVGDCWLAGIGNLGRRPTVENDVDAQRLLEVHLFDFAADLYGMELAVRFEDYIRPEMKFSGIEALKAQIGRDVDLVRGLIK